MVAIHSLFVFATLAAGGDIVLLEFSSPSCGPCQAMQPAIQRLARENYPVRQVNVEQDRELTARFRITQVPTCVLVVNNQEVARVVGTRTYAELVQLFQQAAPQEPAAEELVVRGQSPESQRGLGLFNRLGSMGRQPAADTPASQPNAVDENPFHQHVRPNAVPPANSLPQQPPAQEFAARSPHEHALAATVRLKIEDAGGHSFGTGTIIDTLKDEALVVTCGHIFRESKGHGKISVDVAGAPQPVAGQLLSFDLTRDIALVAIRPGHPVAVAPVAADAQRVVKDVRVFSIGCDHGQDPSVHESHITAVNKYVGAPNYTVAGMPVEGRSGGGLFLADGTLIGICNAADHEDNEGLYAALPLIHWQLDQIGQTALYQRNAGPQRDLVAVPARGEQELRPVPEFAAPPNVQPAGFEAADQEIICIVRSRSQPNSPSQVMVVDRPTPELMQALQAAGPRPHSGMPTGFRTAEGASIVRGQSH